MGGWWMVDDEWGMIDGLSTYSLMFFGSIRIGVSGSKFNAEADFEVRFAVALQKSGPNNKKPIFRFKFFAEKKNQRRKMKRRESTETHFPEVWRLYGPCLRGKRPFKVYPLAVVPRRNQIE